MSRIKPSSSSPRHVRPLACGFGDAILACDVKLRGKLSRGEVRRTAAAFGVALSHLVDVYDLERNRSVSRGVIYRTASPRVFSGLVHLFAVIRGYIYKLNSSMLSAPPKAEQSTQSGRRSAHPHPYKRTAYFAASRKNMHLNISCDSSYRTHLCIRLLIRKQQ